MYYRDAQLFRGRTRRLRRLRWTANAGAIAFATLIAMALLARLILGSHTGLASLLWPTAFMPVFLLACAGAIVNTFVFAGPFRVRCPNCDVRWPRRFPIWIEAR